MDRVSSGHTWMKEKGYDTRFLHAGYSCFDNMKSFFSGNGFGACDLQRKTSQSLLGKNSDGFAAIGPYLVTADRIPDPDNLKLGCYGNGERRQSNNASDMIFDVKTIISYASQRFTLKPGDIFFTGTPEGVIGGMPPEKQVWLKAGDKITMVIEKPGELRFALV